MLNGNYVHICKHLCLKMSVLIKKTLRKIKMRKNQGKVSSHFIKTFLFAKIPWKTSVKANFTVPLCLLFPIISVRALKER